MDDYLLIPHHFDVPFESQRDLSTLQAKIQPAFSKVPSANVIIIINKTCKDFIKFWDHAILKTLLFSQYTDITTYIDLYNCRIVPFRGIDYHILSAVSVYLGEA